LAGFSKEIIKPKKHVDHYGEKKKRRKEIAQLTKQNKIRCNEEQRMQHAGAYRVSCGPSSRWKHSE